MQKAPIIITASLVLAFACGICQASVPAACKRGEEAEKRRQYDQAIQQYTQCLNSGRLGKRALSNYYVRRSLAWSNTNRMDKALSDVNKAVAADSNNAVAYMWRGGIMAGEQKWKKAYADYDKTIKLKMLHPVAFWGRGAALRVMGKYDQAIADFTQAIKINPNFADAYCYRCQAWWEKRQYDKALADCNKAIKLAPRNKRPYFDRGNVWYSKRRYDKAIADYTMTVKLDPQDAYYRNGLAWFLATCPDARYRNGPRAVQLATKATQLKPSAAYFDTLAAAYAETGDFKKAVEVQTKAIEMLRKKKAGEKKIAEYNASLQLYKSGKPFRQQAPR